MGNCHPSKTNVNFSFASVDIGFLRVTISHITLSCYQCLYIVLLPQLLCKNLEGYPIQKFTWINGKNHFTNALAIYEVHVSALNSFMKTTYLCSSLQKQPPLILQYFYHQDNLCTRSERFDPGTVQWNNSYSHLRSDTSQPYSPL